MTWQKVTRWISEETVSVKSKSGNTYPVDVEHSFTAKSLYSQLMNDAHDNKEYWAWVSFDQDTPTLEDYKRQQEGEGPPKKPPWE